MTPIRKHILAWPLLFAIGFLNGTLRVLGYGPLTDELTAHQISSITAIVLFGTAVRFVGRRWPLHYARTAWAVGLTWLALTVAVEFLVGHYLLGHPWSRLFSDYNLLAGRLWIPVLIWITVAPRVFLRTPGDAAGAA